MTPYALRTELRKDPLGIDTRKPRFSWRLPGSAHQDAYEIVLRRVSTGGEAEELWCSGRIEGEAPYDAPYDGPALESMTRYSWQVRVYTRDGATSWSERAVFETGILDPEEWTAHWIGGPETASDEPRTLYFRRELSLKSPVVRARAYTTALGWYKLVVNGTDLTGSALVPRWTPFHHYVEYQAYDLTDVLREGENVLGMVVSEGRFRGRLGAFNTPRVYGDDLAVFAQLVLDLADGSRLVVTTDGTWRVGYGRIISADPMWGERVDLRIPSDGWQHPDGRAEDEQPARVLPETRALVAEEVPPVAQVTALEGEVSRTPAGMQLIDFGQNFSGVAEVRLSGPPGTRIKLLYSEILDQDGELATHYLGLKGEGEWFQRDEVVLGSGSEWYRPSFTIHGFRYVGIEGDIGELSREDVRGVALSSNLNRVGDFGCSDDRLERLWRNAFWSLRSNFTDTATDCPTRERSGWTGDVQIFGPTAAQLVDAQSFLRRYLRNVAAEQWEDGTVPPVIPSETAPGRAKSKITFARTSVGWGDVTVMLPWTLYWYYGDRDVLSRQYASARRWVDSLARRAATKSGLRRRLGRRVGALERYIVDTGYHWGEWLRPGESGMSELFGNFTGKRASIATAYLARSAALLAEIALVLGKEADTARYSSLAEQAARAWRAAFVHDDGARIADDRQDDYVRALAFDLLEPHQRAAAADRLVQRVAEAGDHLDTGFLSTPLLLDTLVDAGHSEVAYRILMQETPPSWLAQIAKGATTMWETWEGYHEDGTPHMSHNHYAFGTVARFLQERVAGLRPAEPGYRRMKIEPVLGAGLTHARTAVDTPYGHAAVRWSLERDHLTVSITVPGGTEADVVLPNLKQTVGPGEHELHCKTGE